MVKMIRDNTGRFAERPFYAARDLDNECERLIRNLLLKRTLGPDSDAYHADHFHYDVAERRRPYCP